MENQNLDDVNQVNEADPAEEPEQEQPKKERLFTQKEVTELIKKRLAKEKAKQAQPSAEAAELTARAARLDCKEYILDNGLSLDLLDIIDTSDVAAFTEKAAKLQTIIDSHMPGYPDVYDGGEVICNSDADIAIKKAFSKGAAHKPKEFNPYG